MTEQDLIKQIRESISKLGARLFRNNTAQGWVGRAQVVSYTTTVRVSQGDVIIRNARPLYAGLCVGSSDLLGWAPVKIEEHHIGETMAVFTAIEVKCGSTRTTSDQANFLRVVREHGGFAGVARNVDEAIEVINGF